MTIEKNGKYYIVTEFARDWKLLIVVGAVSVDYKVPKTDCPTLDALKVFVADNDVF